MFSTRRAALTLAALVALAGCSDDPFKPDLAPEGEARFTYSGDLSGEFLAVGRMNRRNPNAGTWAVGDVEMVGTDRVLGVFGQQRETTLVSGIVLEWRGAQVGSVTCDETTVNCPFVVNVLLGFQNTTGQSEGAYEGDVGTITVTELTDDRAAGTFTLTLPEDVAAPPVDGPKLQVTGSFDVSLALTN
ncbi:MAG TPA: hypothetical protein VFY65_17985 [Longimicrobium sp.]|nr:hypothetical protein [Longimicrobium sp.]